MRGINADEEGVVDEDARTESEHELDEPLLRQRELLLANSAASSGTSNAEAVAGAFDVAPSNYNPAFDDEQDMAELLERHMFHAGGDGDAYPHARDDVDVLAGAPREQLQAVH
eukprot:4157134-Lingulodinium_polyedra.AAC.1